MALHGVVALSFQLPRAEALAVALVFQRRDGRLQRMNALAPGVRLRLGALGDAAQPQLAPVELRVRVRCRAGAAT